MNQQPTQLELQVAQLSQSVQQLVKRLNDLERSDRYTFQKDIDLFDSRNIRMGGSKGCKIGTAKSKIGLYGATPVAQPNSISNPSGGVTVDSQARAAISSIISAISASNGGIGITL